MISEVQKAKRTEGGEERESCGEMKGGHPRRGELRVGANLMAFVDRSADPGLVRRVINVPEVLTVHEKGRLDAVGFEDIEDLVRINVGAIIKGQGKSSRHRATGDDLSHGNGRNSCLILLRQNFLIGISGYETGLDVHRERVNGCNQGGEGCKVEELHG